MSDLPQPFLGSTSLHTRQQLRARRFRRLSRDVYVLATREDDLLLRAAALQQVLPDAVVARQSAAVLLGLPADDDGLLHVVRAPGRSVSRRPGVCTHREPIADHEVLQVRGTAVTTPVRTFLDLARVLDPVELVVLGDAVARREGLHVLAEAAHGAGRRRGAAAARRALRDVDPGSDSPAETRTRLLLHAAGFRGLRHQVTVVDEHGGWVSRPDLADPHARVAVQYDGLVHLDRGAEGWRADIDRDERTRAADWQVVVLTARDLRYPASAVDKVAAAYGRSMALHR